MFYQDNNFHLISFDILVTLLLDKEWISLRKVTSSSSLGAKGLREGGVKQYLAQDRVHLRGGELKQGFFD